MSNLRQSLYFVDNGLFMYYNYDKAYVFAARIKTEVKRMKYVCDVCGWIYDEELGMPEEGIAPGTKFEDLPDDFACPLCGVGKDSFSQEG